MRTNLEIPAMHVVYSSNELFEEVAMIWSNIFARSDTTTYSSFSLSATRESGSLVYCFDLPMTHILRAISRLSVLILYGLRHG